MQYPGSVTRCSTPCTSVSSSQVGDNDDDPAELVSVSRTQRRCLRMLKDYVMVDRLQMAVNALRWMKTDRMRTEAVVRAAGNDAASATAVAALVSLSQQSQPLAYDQLDIPASGVSEQDVPVSLDEQGSEGQIEYDSDDDMRPETYKPVFDPLRRMWDPVEEQKANEGGGIGSKS
jgi:hypothetical protein